MKRKYPPPHLRKTQVRCACGRKIDGKTKWKIMDEFTDFVDKRMREDFAK